MVKLKGGEAGRGYFIILEISCIVLAGGKSSRFGHDKVFKTIGEQNLLDLVIDRVSPLSREVILVTAGKNALKASGRYPDLRTITDVYPGKGPLGGVYTGLLSSRADFNLVVASDMPFLNTGLLRYMVQVSAGFNITVPRIDGLTEPLHSIYTRNCLEPMADLLKNDELSLNRLFSLVSTKYVEADEIEQYDPEHLSFFNVNTKADLARAEEIARGMKP